MWTADEAMQIVPALLLVVCFALGFIAGQQR